MKNTRISKPLIYIGILLGGIILGLTVGTKYGTKAALIAQDLTAIANYSFYTDIQFKNAEYPEAKEALLNFIKLLEDSKDSKDPMISESILTFDKMLAYGRLAQLTRKNGHEAEAKKFMDLAVEECNRTSWKDCSDEKVEHVLSTMERSVLQGTERGQPLKLSVP